MKIYNYLVLGSLALLSACSKNDVASPSQKPDLIEGYTLAQIDSIATHYGWKFTTERSTKNAMKVKDFIALMEKRNQFFTPKNGRTTVVAVQVLNTSIYGSAAPKPPTAGMYGLTWNFPDLKSMAYPSLYYMLFSAPTPLGGVTIHGVTFNYDGTDGPLTTTDWSYNHLFSSASGGYQLLNVSNNGTETELITLAGFTTIHTYSVLFTITQQTMLASSPIVAYIKIQKLGS